MGLLLDKGIGPALSRCLGPTVTRDVVVGLRNHSVVGRRLYSRYCGGVCHETTRGSWLDGSNRNVSVRRLARHHPLSVAVGVDDGGVINNI